MLKSTDRLERKYRQAQDDYKLAIEKYNSIRNTYEKRFCDGLFYILFKKIIITSLYFISLYKISRFRN